MFEHRLLEARKKKGLTQKQVADQAQIHVASYSAYENNRKIPPVDILLRISNALDVSLDWLCKNEKEIPTANTYGDIARSIMSIMQRMGNQCKINASTNHDGYEYAQIILWDEVIHGFIEKAHKFDEMSKGSDDERELYFAWIEKKLVELDKTPVNPVFEEVDDEDLPY